MVRKYERLYACAQCVQVHMSSCVCGVSELESKGVGVSQSIRIEMKFVAQSVWMEKVSRQVFVSCFQVKLYTPTN